MRSSGPYLLWAVRCAFKFRPFRLVIEHEDGRRDKVWATAARIANGTHLGGVEILENQEADSGEKRPLLQVLHAWH